jgi:hypothetical protein
MWRTNPTPKTHPYHPWLKPGVSRAHSDDSTPSWREIEQDAPDFTLRARRCFDAGTNKTLTTLRRDGAPRINASEIEFSSGGEVVFSMMPGSMKLLDVLRDPRLGSTVRRWNRQRMIPTLGLATPR